MSEIKVKFAQGCFPDDMTQEEIDEIVKEITSMVEDGSLMANSEPLDMDKLEVEDPEMYHQLMQMENHKETVH